MRLGFYAGSFNPFHLGHWDIYNQAKQQFEMVVIGVGKNPEKDAINIVGNEIPNRDTPTISVYSGFLSEELKKWSSLGHDVTLVRGLRNVHDLGEEQNLIAFVRNMYPELKVVYFLSRPENQHISSRALRDIKKFSETEYRKWLVPKK